VAEERVLPTDVGAGTGLVARITAELHKRIVGQDAMLERLLIGLPPVDTCCWKGWLGER
jgi:2-polyprenyl-3-methyl-5-hydroxy-6-metoxy-1,4-benzoquinol methylase